MKKKIREMAGYLLSLAGFYVVLNYVRNNFLKPVFYDVFVCENKENGKGSGKESGYAGNSGHFGKSVCVIGPPYSAKGFLKSSCICMFSGGSIVLPPVLVNDPDKSCMVVTFNIPAYVSDASDFKYVIVRGGVEIFSGKHTAAKTPVPRKKLSITTLFKYETDFLREWIEHHRKVGVEHFYIYENNAAADPKVTAILAPYVRDGVVTHILWPHPYLFYNYKVRKLWPNDVHLYTQASQIHHSLYKFAGETEWLLSCDVDEYFYSPVYTSLTDAVGAVVHEGDVSSICIRGTWFGGTVTEVARAKKDGVVRTFIRSEKSPTSAYKCIFETSSVRMVSVHESLVRDKREVVAPPDVLRFNHYRALGWKKRLDERFARDIENMDIQR